jgi:hypothetical protein
MRANQKSLRHPEDSNGQSGQTGSRKEEAKEIGNQAAKQALTGVQAAGSNDGTANRSGLDDKLLEPTRA